MLNFAFKNTPTTYLHIPFKPLTQVSLQAPSPVVHLARSAPILNAEPVAAPQSFMKSAHVPYSMSSSQAPIGWAVSDSSSDPNLSGEIIFLKLLNLSIIQVDRESYFSLNEISCRFSSVMWVLLRELKFDKRCMTLKCIIFSSGACREMKTTKNSQWSVFFLDASQMIASCPYPVLSDNLLTADRPRSANVSRVQVLYPYSAQHHDELDIRPGKETL